MILTRRDNEAIKTALAMTIIYGITLQMGFGKPMSAGVVVALISLATVGSKPPVFLALLLFIATSYLTTTRENDDGRASAIDITTHCASRRVRRVGKLVCPALMAEIR
jgi:hypothetical protein